MIKGTGSGDISSKKEIYRATMNCHFIAYFGGYTTNGNINVYLNDTMLFAIKYVNATNNACCGVSLPDLPRILGRVKTVSAMPSSNAYYDCHQILDIYLKEGDYISAQGPTEFSYYVYDRLERG